LDFLTGIRPLHYLRNRIEPRGLFVHLGQAAIHLVLGLL